MNENAKRVLEEQTLNLLNSGAVLTVENRNKLENIITDLQAIYATPISEDKEIREASYTNYGNLITEYGKTLGETKYNLLLKKEEYLYLKNLIMKKISYDRQNLFVGLLVRDNFFYKFDKNKNHNQTELFTNGDVEAFQLDINEITRISHLTGLNEIQGLDNKADMFANIIKKIGDISKIFDIYKSKGDNLSEDAGNWIQGFEKFEPLEQVDAEQVDAQ